MPITPDVRLEYLEGVTSTILKFKPDRWGEMVAVEENKALFTEFFEKPDILVLVVTCSPAGGVTPCLGFPGSLKSKGVYFIKKRPENIGRDNYRDSLIYGDISPTPVDQLIVITEEVLYTLLNQSENMSGWPRVVSEDIVKQVHKLKNEMFVMGGKIKGKTLLPIPERLGSPDGTLESMERIPPSLDSSLLHAIESVIIDWSHQIRDVLSKNSAQPLLDGLHPLPRVEFEFWDAQLMNLKCIHEQLNRPKVNKIVEILEKAKSCYWPALQNVYMNITEGLKEASDIVLYLKPLRILLEEMEQADFTALPTFIAKVLYTTCSIWATSEHYNVPSRVIVILQEFCNQLIEMTRTFLSPDEVLKGLRGEVEEALSRISLSVNVLKALYRTYDFCCANVKLFFKKDKEPVPWEFPSSLAFSRMNSFFRRIQTIEDLYKTAIEFLKLEKIELGGVRGRILGSRIAQVYSEVFELVKVFADCKYDPLDPGDSSFDDDYADFENKIQDLDRRLATIFCQAFDDSNSIESCAKLLHMCGSLLERPLILAEVAPRYLVMLELFDAELDNTKVLYDAQFSASAGGALPLIHRNMPSVAGQLKWSLELQERLEAPMRDLKHIEHPVMSSVEAKLIYQKYDEMVELLRRYREKVHQQWVAGVDQDCRFNLGQPLTRRDPITSLLQVNFSKALVAVLREVKYLNFQQQKEIPSSAKNLFSQQETFRKFVGNLELIVGWYNEIKTTVMDVEFPLVKSELEAIDVKLLDAETTLFWNGEGVFEYIQEMREILHNLQNRMQKAKQNIDGISQAMKDWSANPMFERKDNKKEALLDLNGRMVNLNKRYTMVRDAGLKIQAMVTENAELFRADTTSSSWKDYINYIDKMVLDEFDGFIRQSLNYLTDNMVIDESVAPLFEVHMELDEDGPVFNPSLEVGSDYGFLTLIESLLNDIYNAAMLIPRLARGQMNYKVSLGFTQPTHSPYRGTKFSLPCLGIYIFNDDGSECARRPEVPIPSVPPGLQTGFLSPLLPKTCPYSQSTSTQWAWFSVLGLFPSLTRLREELLPTAWHFIPLHNLNLVWQDAHLVVLHPSWGSDEENRAKQDKGPRSSHTPSGAHPTQGLCTGLLLLPLTCLPVSSLTSGYFLREHPPTSSPSHLKARVQVRAILQGGEIKCESWLQEKRPPVCSLLPLQTDLEDMTDLTEMREELYSLVISAMKGAEEYQDSLERYSYLWTADPQESMRNFLVCGRAVTPADLDSRAEEALPRTPPTLTQFQQQIDSYETLYEEVSKCENTKVFNGWLQCDCGPFKQALLNTIKRWSLMFKRHLSSHVTDSLADLEAFMKVTRMGLTKTLKEGDYDGLVDVMGHLLKVKERQVVTDNMFEPLKQTIELLKTYGEKMPEEIHVKLQELPEQWTNTKKLAIQVKQNVVPLQANEVSILRRKCQQFELKQHEFREKFRREAPFTFSDPDPYKSLNKQQRSIAAMESMVEALGKSGSLFEVPVPDYKQLKACHKEVCLLKELWDMVVMVNTSMDDWKTTRWKDMNVEQMDIDCKKFAKDVRSLDKEMKTWDAFMGLDNTVKNMITSLRAVSELQNPAIRDRHWQQLMQAAQVKFKMSDETTLADLLQLNLHKHEDEVRNIVDKAVKESGMEKVLKALESTWSTMEFEHEPHQRTGTMMLRSDEALVETLEDNQVQLQNLMMSKYLSHFLKEVTSWQQKLSVADSVISLWFEVQRTWSHLESIFIGSEDIRTQLPEDSRRFDEIDLEFKALMEGAVKTPNVLDATNKPGLCNQLENLKQRLAVCEKALAEYLDTKRLAFPRFYFVSSADLLDILSNGNDPVEVSRHLSKLFDSLCKLKFRLDADGRPVKLGLGMYSKEDEYVDFDQECDLSGQVEVWLNRVLDRMCATLRHEIPEAVVTYEEKPREQWIFDYPAQVALTCTQIWWTTEVGLAFARLEEGYENAVKDYNKKQISQLNALITLLMGNLSTGDRMKIMTICTIDVHARDIVESSQAFTWQSQLRHRWDEEKRHCFANICDAQIQYSYEYLGNTPRLVITPLTDRCYITLTQSLHLIMGGAPAGPAGTGKTETTKDLGRALGTMVYVFNCSEQMDYKSCGNIYKGLAQTGAWGCFDEFNRISVEVLSVIAVQVKCVQDAIRAKKKTFNFLGEMITLNPSVGLFITMNPGYAGRTELPENLKALFRPCAMVVPDFELICEIMLVAEGFLDARLLARKFITLYTLCKELLSKQDHYDWGLRAIKSVLVVAGSLKRGDPSRAEDQVLMRALRDFNIPKIVTDDLPVFMGLIGDLFPALDVPRKRDLNFEQIIKQSIVELKLQAEDSFVLKVVQLEELLQVRHSVFVIGNAGSGKSQACLPAPVPPPTPPRGPGGDAGWSDSITSPTHGTPARCVLGGSQPEIWAKKEAVRGSKGWRRRPGAASGHCPADEPFSRALPSCSFPSTSTCLPPPPPSCPPAPATSPRPITLLSPVPGHCLRDDEKQRVLKSLNKTYQKLKRKPVAVDLDPKAVTCDELYGIINPATREWKDGLFSTIMRDLANITHDGPKWMILDGDIDPMWIESLNTVMDDNKVLTLASNERIPLNRTMRLVFEISHLRTATPATVSRAGILYINPADLGWNPVVSSWIERRKVQSEKANLMILFDKYLPTCLEKLHSSFKKITPVPEITVIQTILCLLECLLTEKNAPPDSPKELYELYFVFACFWAFGGAMFQDQLVDYRVEFSKWWVNEFKTIKFPLQGTIFDYYIDPDTKKFLPWTDKVPHFELDPDIPLQASLVHTTETIRLRYFMDLLTEKAWPVMLVGNAGTGKSVLMCDKLESLSTDEYLVQTVPFNFYTTSAMLQGVLEKPLEKKSGRNFGPPGTKKLIYFIDDMNTPEVDKYDRQKLTLKDVHNCQYVACMNPTSGSFTIDPRLQRHFCVFAVSFPGQEALTTIYSTILSQHLAFCSAPMVVHTTSSQLVASALALHQKVTATFLPTAIKFHYVFNLRDLSNIFQVLYF
ncbi:LOW QUALITY PROTEIN: hypothetical protein MC885_016050 [Smutsia gigantea]|nr:LOW QUALITY PROTEIN: hypothetical protein MC885_016050 [Smutsia gigantea]